MFLDQFDPSIDRMRGVLDSMFKKIQDKIDDAEKELSPKVSICPQKTTIGQYCIVLYMHCY